MRARLRPSDWRRKGAAGAQERLLWLSREGCGWTPRRNPLTRWRRRSAWPSAGAWRAPRGDVSGARPCGALRAELQRAEGRKAGLVEIPAALAARERPGTQAPLFLAVVASSE